MRLRRRLTELADRQPREASRLLAAIGDIDVLTSLYLKAISGRTGDAEGVRRGSRFTWGGPRSYRIAEVRGEPVLGEYLSDHPPLYCDRRNYDATAYALAHGKEALTFLDLVKRYRDRLASDRAPDYPVRLCLRFWRLPDHPIIRKQGTKYGTVPDRGFERLAAELWDKLAKEAETQTK
jgi:hypothetical protein